MTRAKQAPKAPAPMGAHQAAIGEFDGRIGVYLCLCGHPIVASSEAAITAAFRDHVGFKS